MMKVFFHICLLILTFVVVAQASAIKNTSGHDIVDGDCLNSRESDRVFYDHVYKNAIPLFKRSETEKYTGSRTIYCIQVLNQKSEETGGSAWISGGGTSQTYVTIELESDRGHGLDFFVSIYAFNDSHVNLTKSLA